MQLIAHGAHLCDLKVHSTILKIPTKHRMPHVQCSPKSTNNLVTLSPHVSLAVPFLAPMAKYLFRVETVFLGELSQMQLNTAAFLVLMLR